MRKFRTTAVAAATAFSLTIAGTGVAAAQDDAAEDTQSFNISSNSSQLGEKKDAWEDGEDGPYIDGPNQVTGTDLLGSSTADKATDEKPGVPEWADDWRNIAYVGVAGSIIGAIVAGINWLKFQGILPY
ncbi:hypothetical protein [Corynebacterium suedekumii]|uniref:Or membrane protein n=1 Tax=Corynebacterium suedekumii TaxID=3049801 RepID=A0ABY8VK98_9CORY|nr:hypothetical protein [Corynebacterium suedekumii]WIM69989.1 hypothetical protein QP029_12465 [Corynebacterium suedekumii]